MGDWCTRVAIRHCGCAGRWGADVGVPLQSGHTSCTGPARVASGAPQQARGPHRDIDTIM